LPDWLQVKIQDDATKIPLNRHNLQWTTAEDKLLSNLTKIGCSFHEISIRLNRTPSSIKSRFYSIRYNNFNSELISNI